MRRFNDRGGSGGGGGGFRRFGPPVKHKATCSECGQECEVPFRPNEGRPVYCNDCWSKRRRDTA